MMLFTYGDNDYDDEGNIIPSTKYLELKMVKGIRIDRRTSDEPVGIPFYRGNKELADQDWYGEGKNHRVIDGHIERDFDDEFLVIELNSLEDLLEFQKKYETNVGISNRSGYIYNGKELNTFHFDYYME